MRALFALLFALLAGPALAQTNPGTSPLSIAKGGTGCTSASGRSSSTFLRGDCNWATPGGSGNVSGPGSAASGNLASYNGTTGTIIQDSAIPSAGVDGNVLNPQTANYTIATTDCSKTVQESGGGPFTVTLPAVGGFAATCHVTVCNANPNVNGQHAVLLVGFPNPVFARLYMQQCVSVGIVGGAWMANKVPGRFRPAFSPTLFVDNGGSSLNDGFVSNAAGNALQTMQQCLSILQNEYDLIGQQPTCSPTGGQTLIGSFAQIGVPVASSVIKFAGNGGVADLRPTAGGSAVLQWSDFAGYFISTNINFDCTGGAASCIGVSFHLEGGADFNGGTKFTGAGAGQVAINCDGRCKINFNSDATSPVVFSGSFLSAIVASQNSTMVAFNGLTLDNSATVASDLFTFQQGVRFQFRGALNGGTATSVGGSTIRLQSQSTACLTSFTQAWSVQPTQKFTVLNGSILMNVSANPLPGTAAGSVTTSGIGFANGFAPDGANTNTGVNASGC